MTTILGWLLIARAITVGAEAPGRIEYHRDVAPILARHCTACHHPELIDQPETSGGVSLASWSELRQSRKGLVVAGFSKKSPLHQRLIHPDPDRRMPKDSDPLSTREIDLIARWIDQGAIEGSPPAGSVSSPARRRSRGTDVHITLGQIPPEKKSKDQAARTIQAVVAAGPLDAVTALAFDGSGQILVAGSYQQLTWWDLSALRPIRADRTPQGIVHEVAFSSDGERLFFAGGEPGRRGEVASVNRATGERIWSIARPKDVVTALALSPDGKRIAATGMDGAVFVADAISGKIAWDVKGHSEAALSVAWAMDGSNVFSGGRDRAVKMWESAKGAQEKVFRGHSADILALGVTSDRNDLWSGGSDGTVRKWSLAKGATTSSTAAGLAPVLSFAREGERRLYWGRNNGEVLSHSPDDKSKTTLQAGSTPAYALAASSKGMLAVGSWDGVARLFVRGNKSADLFLIRAASGSSQSVEVAEAGGSASAPRTKTEPSTDFDWLILTSEGNAHGSPQMVNRTRLSIGGRIVDSKHLSALFDEGKRAQSLLRKEERKVVQKAKVR